MHISSGFRGSLCTFLPITGLRPGWLGWISDTFCTNIEKKKFLYQRFGIFKYLFRGDFKVFYSFSFQYLNWFVLTVTLLVMGLLICFVNCVSELRRWEFRALWSLSLCYLIFACVQDYAGIVNSFLSLPLWQPLSRMSFTILLIHPLLIIVNEVNRKNGQFFTKFAFVRIKLNSL